MTPNWALAFGNGPASISTLFKSFENNSHPGTQNFRRALTRPLGCHAPCHDNALPHARGKQIGSANYKSPPGNRFEADCPFVVEHPTIGQLEIPTGFQFDGNSLPRPFEPPSDAFESGVVHDFLYRYGYENRNTADRDESGSQIRSFVWVRSLQRSGRLAEGGLTWLTRNSTRSWRNSIKSSWKREDSMNLLRCLKIGNVQLSNALMEFRGSRSARNAPPRVRVHDSKRQASCPSSLPYLFG